jgi:hypothetical protein
VADAHRQRRVAKDLVSTSSRGVAEYLSILDDAAFSGAARRWSTRVISPTDPAARYTASANSVAGHAYSDDYLIDRSADNDSPSGSWRGEHDTRPNG